MKRTLLLFIAALLFLHISSFAKTAESDMDDAMARAYKYATEEKLDKSKDWFIKAATYAKEVNNWQGLIDSGYGFSTLGLPKEAANNFTAAEEITNKLSDWHAKIALGYAFASLPDEQHLLGKSVKSFKDAKKIAQEKEDIFGLIEAGRGLASINKNKQSEECLDLAKDILKEFPTEEATKALVHAYRKLGKEAKASECIGFRTKTDSGQFPPGWKPTAGETTRSAKTVSPEIQKIQRESADKDIQAREEWEQQRAKQRHEEKLQKQRLAYDIYRDHLNYYSYPYYGIYSGVITNYNDYYHYSWSYRPIWTRRTHPEIYNWALWHYGRYTHVNGVYISVDID